LIYTPQKKDIIQKNSYSGVKEMQKRIEEIETNHKSQLNKLETYAADSILNANKKAYKEFNVMREKFQIQMNELNQEAIDLKDDKNQLK